MAITPGVVHVTFIDHSNGATLGEVDLHASRLPAAFDTDTVLQLLDDAWQVVSAEPADSAAYLLSGTLRLTLRHATRIATPDASLAPRTALFAQPTMVDPLPASTAPRPDENLLELREDDWRQIELMTEEAFATTQHEFEPIARVKDEARVPGGYTRTHPRRGVDAPLAGVGLSPAGLRAVFKRVVREYAAVAFTGRPGAIEGAFAFRTAGDLTVYGVAHDDRVQCVGLRPDRDRRGPPVDFAALAQLRRTYALLLVDWSARTVVRPGTKPGDVS